MTAAIRVQGLSYSVTDGRRVLGDVSFEIPERSRTALVGPSGAGKSTLLLHLIGLLPTQLPAHEADSRIRIGGLALTRDSVREVRRRAGLVFQNPDDQAFCTSVREELAFGPRNLGLPRDEILRRIERALNQAGLRGFEERSIFQLSAGEKKRLCLSAVLACDPQAVILDEPTSNLDPRTRRGMIEVLRSIPCTQLIATHDMDLAAELCDRVLILDAGRICADGPASEVLSNAALMERHGLEVPPMLRR